MDDLISRQATLDCFHDWIDSRGDVHTADEIPEYNAIMELPPVQPDNQINLCDSCDYSYPDCPAKNDDVIFGNGIGNDNTCACNKYKPSVQPERKKGEWINTNPEYKNGFYNNSYYCSQCHDYYTTSPYEMKFCPNCGADMRGEKHG